MLFRECPFFLVAVFALTCFAGPESVAQPKPNVLFIAVDDLNNDLGCYGHPLVQSPNIDRLARRGMRFDRAYCQYPVCNPSRASLMTGLYPEQTGVLSNAGDFRIRHPDITTLSQHFMSNGYFAARVGKIYHYGVPLQIGTSGKDDPASWNKVVNPIGIDRTELEPVTTLQKGKYGGTLSWRIVESRDEEHTDGKGALEAIRLIEKNHPDKTGKPFFLAMGFFRPHTPYVAPAHYAKLYPLDKIDPVLEKPGDRDDIPPAALADRAHQRELSLAKRREIIQAYYASITLMDSCVGKLLDALDRLKLADNTIVVFFSDHGYHLGQHGLWQKSDLFEGSARVPLILSVPGMKNAGRATESLAELIDLYPTLADLCGLAKPAHLKGQSLAPVLNDPSAIVRQAAFTVSNARGKIPGHRGAKPLGHTIRTKRYRYTEWGGGKHGIELYDYKTDPDEYTNSAKRDSGKKALKRMQRLMQSTREHTR
ncbi:MAG: sulfatase [Verrucomicrobiota bacterium]|jgi:arylsulfatase A-like enzyme|nr:sulfatase [Verrucomicrobiota bacterium]